MTEVGIPAFRMKSASFQCNFLQNYSNAESQAQAEQIFSLFRAEVMEQQRAKRILDWIDILDWHWQGATWRNELSNPSTVG